MSAPKDLICLIVELWLIKISLAKFRFRYIGGLYLYYSYHYRKKVSGKPVVLNHLLMMIEARIDIIVVFFFFLKCKVILGMARIAIKIVLVM